MKKKQLLFVIDSLVAAGAEKSLITLLSLLDYNKYSVDLMLFAQGGVLEKQLPRQVNVLRPLYYTTFAKLNIKSAIFDSVKRLNFRMLFSRIAYSVRIRLKSYKNPQKARLFWENVSRVIEENPKSYDIAISYAQGISTFYVAEKTKARKKFAWVNVSYRLDEKEAAFQKSFYDQFHQIIAVSDTAKDIFLQTFPRYRKKVGVIYDLNDPKLICQMADAGEGYKDHFDGLRILTVGRLNYQKGYDMALEACKKLKESGVNFRWYVLGKGPLRKEIERYINKHQMENHFVLLGVTDNPYPYIKNCDIYVQTSRFEGFGLAIAEARMLNKPVVTTRFDAVYTQMVDGKNGMVVDLNAEAVYEGILKMINDQPFKDSIVNYLKEEKKGNLEELEKFYQLIG